MKELQFFKIGFILLVLLNVTLVAFLILGKPNRHDPMHQLDEKRHLNEVLNILELEGDQVEEFKKLADEHHQEMLELEKLQKKNVSAFFKKNLALEADQSQEIIGEIEQWDERKIRLTLQHFEAVKEILGEQQKENFDDFTEWVMDKLLKSHGEHRKPPKGGQKHQTQ